MNLNFLNENECLLHGSAILNVICNHNFFPERHYSAENIGPWSLTSWPPHSFKKRRTAYNGSGLQLYWILCYPAYIIICLLLYLSANLLTLVYGPRERVLLETLFLLLAEATKRAQRVKGIIRPQNDCLLTESHPQLIQGIGSRSIQQIHLMN